MKAEWDEAKNRANQRNHGVSFEEAGQLFAAGGDYLEIFDHANSDFEDRFVAIGPITRGLVVVAWTDGGGDTVRIISARWATKRQQSLYHSFRDKNHD